jgi:hypothetical protein
LFERKGLQRAHAVRGHRDGRPGSDFHRRPPLGKLAPRRTAARACPCRITAAIVRSRRTRSCRTAAASACSCRTAAASASCPTGDRRTSPAPPRDIVELSRHLSCHRTRLTDHRRHDRPARTAVQADRRLDQSIPTRCFPHAK